MNSKRWFTSKTEIFNALAILGIILNYFFGIELDAELQAVLATSIVGVVNMILRIKYLQA